MSQIHEGVASFFRVEKRATESYEEVCESTGPGIILGHGQYRER